MNFVFFTLSLREHDDQRLEELLKRECRRGKFGKKNKKNFWVLLEDVTNDDKELLTNVLDWNSCGLSTRNKNKYVEWIAQNYSITLKKNNISMTNSTMELC
jgi:3-hydroxyacyl-CoA dehydrogenase